MLSLRVPLCVRQKVDGSPTDQLRLWRLHHQLDWSPWFDQGAPYLRSSCLDGGLHQHQLRSLSKIMEEPSREPGGSTSTLPSGDRAVFLDSKLASAVTASSSVALTIASVELCGIESTTLENFVEFRWRNLWQSPIYRSRIESGRESGRV